MISTTVKILPKSHCCFEGYTSQPLDTDLLAACNITEPESFVYTAPVTGNSTNGIRGVAESCTATQYFLQKDNTTRVTEAPLVNMFEISRCCQAAFESDGNVTQLREACRSTNTLTVQAGVCKNTERFFAPNSNNTLISTTEVNEIECCEAGIDANDISSPLLALCPRKVTFSFGDPECFQFTRAVGADGSELVIAREIVTPNLCCLTGVEQDNDSLAAACDTVTSWGLDDGQCVKMVITQLPAGS